MTANEDATAVPTKKYACSSSPSIDSTESNLQGDSILPAKTCGKYVHLDVTRVSCIVVIALCASEPSWLEYNTLFFQNWVIQYLWLVCGICYGLSSRPLLQYLGRLLLYFFIGIAAIWTACRIKKVKGLPMGGDMWFVLVYAIFSLLLKPLKMRILRMQEDPQRFLISAPTRTRKRLFKGIAWICGGQAILLLVSALVIIPLGVLAVHHFRLSDNLEAYTFIMHICAEVQACLSAVWIVYCVPYYFSDGGVIAWLLLANMYTFKFVCGYGETAFFSSGFQLLLIGLTASNLGLSKREQVSICFRRYWMVVVFLCAWCFTPGTHGWLMMTEPKDLWTRERFILLEVLLVVGWLVSGADWVDPKIFEADDLMWISDWASLLFLLHQALLISVPQACWLVFVGLMPASWIFRRIAGSSATVSK